MEKVIAERVVTGWAKVGWAEVEKAEVGWAEVEKSLNEEVAKGNEFASTWNTSTGSFSALNLFF